MEFSSPETVYLSLAAVLTSLKLGHCYKLNWPKRVSAVHWLLGTLPYPCLFVNILGIYCFLVFLCALSHYVGAKLSGCQMVRCQIFYFLILVPNCPFAFLVPNYPFLLSCRQIVRAILSGSQIIRCQIVLPPIWQLWLMSHWRSCTSSSWRTF